MRALLIVIVAACSHALPVKAPAASDVIIRQTHTVLDAFDRGDVATARALTAPSFVRFEAGQIHERDAELARLKPRPLDQARTWKSERVFASGDAATFIGLAAEHELGNDSHGNREFDGWYTLSWVRDGEAWKLAEWSYQSFRTAEEFRREFWNDSFRQDIGFTHEPNQLLVTTTGSATPGTALDIAAGQGRNAVYLATRGWKVTAIDISNEGLDRARDAAARAHVALDAMQTDLHAYDYGVAKWDLVTEIYVPDSISQLDKIKAALKPGGVFVLEFFVDGADPKQLETHFRDGFDILVDEVVDGHPDWGEDRAKLVRFVARKR